MSALLNKIITSIFLFLMLHLHGQKPVCGNELNANDSLLMLKTKEADRKIAQFMSSNMANSRSEITIPVVVHIVWHEYEENLSYDLVLSQIEALNRDFNAENAYIQDIPDEFKSVIGNVDIRFCLAAIDSQGNSTIGIIRTYTNISEIGLTDDLYFTSNGGSDAWNTEKYLNIWVANTGKLISGLGTYPNQTLPEKTGVIIHPKYFGINGHSKYGLGRVAAHEIGHYLGLKHLWADDLDCNTDDEVSDTPPQQEAHTGCPNYPQSGCSQSEIFMNFMDYVDDPCMVMFTKGQADRMLATINAYRSGLLENSINCLTPYNSENNQLTIYPNPGSGLFVCRYGIAPMGIVKYEIYNSIGHLIKYENKIINHEFIIDLQTFSAGIYLLKVGGNIYKLVKI